MEDVNDLHSTSTPVQAPDATFTAKVTFTAKELFARIDDKLDKMMKVIESRASERDLRALEKRVFNIEEAAAMQKDLRELSQQVSNLQAAAERAKGAKERTVRVAIFSAAVSGAFGLVNAVSLIATHIK